jgi:hypothetical protein
VIYAVPHEEKVINSIISSAVDEFWEQRQYGEPLTDLHPSEAFYTHEEIDSDLLSNSRRVFKTVLFDVSGIYIHIHRQLFDLDYVKAFVIGFHADAFF